MAWKDIEKDYIRVDSTLPCPVCGHMDGCLVHRSGDYAICYHVQSNKLWKNGYVHTINEPTETVKKALGRPYKARTPCRVDWDTLNKVFVASITDKQCNKLANNLGVTPESLKQLSIGWSRTRNAYTFPVRGAQCEIVGIQTRQLNGQKRMIRGSRVGVFTDFPCSELPAVVYITEGVSDTASAKTIGLSAVGRFNAVSCAEILRILLANRMIHIIADNSGPEIQGATQLVWDLRKAGINSNLIVLPFCVKDLREAVNEYGREPVKRYIMKQVNNART